MSSGRLRLPEAAVQANRGMWSSPVKDILETVFAETAKGNGRPNAIRQIRQE